MSRAAAAAIPAPATPILRDRRAQLTILGVFVVAFAVFLRTCARTVTGEDAGELITAAATGGVEWSAPSSESSRVWVSDGR